jgi:hypothetical protein
LAPPFYFFGKDGVRAMSPPCCAVWGGRLSNFFTHGALPSSVAASKFLAKRIYFGFCFQFFATLRKGRNDFIIDKNKNGNVWFVDIPTSEAI